MIKRIKNICRRWWGQFWYFSPMIAIGDFFMYNNFKKF